MKRSFRLAGLLAGIAAFGAMLAGVGTMPTTVHALTNCTGGDEALDAQESAFLTLINNYRAANGRSALTTSTNLNRAAAWMAYDMGAKSYFNHTDSANRSPSTRARNCGFPGDAGENIAAGTVWDTAQEAFTAWQNSPGHNSNMLNASYRTIGIGREFVSGSPYGWYWVTDFGLIADGTSAAPTPTPTATVKAAMAAPSAGTRLNATKAQFRWTTGSGALEYRLDVGSTPGGTQYYGASRALVRSATVNGLPVNGSTLYVRLWTRFASGWQYTDYSYLAATGPASTLLRPVNGSVVRGGQASFTWTAASGALEYRLDVGTAPGGTNFYSGAGPARSRTVAVPTSGTFHARLWTRFATGWQYRDYSFRAAP